MIKAVEAMGKLRDNEVLQVITDHAPALESIPTQAKRRGFAVRISELGPSEWQITIAKGSVEDMAEKAQQVDLRGRRGQDLIAAVQDSLQGIPRGQIIEVLVDSRRAIADLSLALGDAGQDMLGVAQIAPGVWAIDIRKVEE